ncbi:MAG TPA: nucleoside-diphosphate kinase [Patescibacteria group bacterium]|jgi:nucleoside-diphosphate kinase|nr:nucleoside-diphosphate kinase [Patescibacteria group bacterium]
METIEQSLVLLKPDTLERGLVGEILQRFERVGLKIVGMKLMQPTQAHAESHYTEDLAIRQGENVRNTMVKMLTSSPIVAVVLEGIEAVEVIRKMIGSTQPIAAAPGTIRGDYAHVSFKHANRDPDGNLYNLIHGSATVEEAKAEIAVWFTPEELVDHNPKYTSHTLA